MARTKKSSKIPYVHPSAENRELVEVIRKLGELLQGDTHINWEENRRRGTDILRRLGSTCEKSHAVSKRIRGVPTETGGSEHILIRLIDEPQRVFKTTYGDNLGCSSEFFPKDPELTGKHFHAKSNANPFFYLERWIWLNSIGEYQTRYEGILLPEIEGHLPRICVSQPSRFGT